MVSDRASFEHVQDRGAATGRASRFGYLGRIAKEKGVELLGKASAAASVSILVGGSGPAEYSTEVFDRYRTLTPLGVVEPSQFLPEIDVLVIPSSWNEPLGRVVFEAARFNKRVIISDVPGLIEAASMSGIEYATFNRGDSASLAGLLERCVSDEIQWERTSTRAATSSILQLIETVQKRGA